MLIEIDENSANQRFDRFLRKYLKPYPSVKLTDIFSAIRKGEILLNGRKTKGEKRLSFGDEVSIPDALLQEKEQARTEIKERKKSKLSREAIAQMILFEDEHWCVFDKPAGIVLHESNKHRDDLSMNDYFEWYASDCQQGTFKPSFGYRLDKDTSGVLVGAKTYEALQYLNVIIRERKIDKTYLTLVSGKTPQHFVVQKAIERVYDKAFDRAKMVLQEGGLDSKTECSTLKSFIHPELGAISLLRVKIYTGRMHQIRIHLASEGYPVLGDLIYGNPVLNRKLNKVLHIKRQLLHCYQYRFTDWNGVECSFIAPIPGDFQQVLGKMGMNFIL